eukprot:CAMPEP_0183703926 /NCGR_PEP_ID=MMETSP0737-20130205/1465_1 /TAXON_ID=385413 /ORGANISM="Thalassiosira miniscula, Strain CCMP1093" /LENGTH=563 /DNA_ID=CAMNT_0025930731 /DNA_START=86 /DNA_END=1777 /DNA_ORIENTATION=+
MMTPSAATSPIKILIVTGDCPSHPYACSKLATVLATNHHDVTMAGPNGSALLRLQAEAAKYNNTVSSSTTVQKKIKEIDCLSIGNVTTKVHCNVRPVVNPHNCSPLKILCNTLCNRAYNPYGIANDFERMMDDQAETYENLKRILPKYDLVYAIHTAAGTVCDALESLQQQQEQKESSENLSTSSLPEAILFSSLPYNSSFCQKWNWKVPRSIVALPQVATYSVPRKILFEESGGFFLVRLVSYFLHLFWMILDTYLAERAWTIAAKRADERRASRGLPPTNEAMRYYWMTYPLLSLGGTKPYIAEGDGITPNATVVGSIRSSDTSDLSRLEEWFARANVDSIVYTSFGTGTQLTEEETTNLAKLAVSLAKTEHCLLLSFPKDSQERLQHVFDNVLGSQPTTTGDGFIEYNNGTFRIDNDVPQENLLLAKSQSNINGSIVKVFVSHMGFGGYTEAIYGGVPFVAYPAGCDQWYNTERAIEAGVAMRALPRMQNLDITVKDAIRDEEMKGRSQELAANAAKMDSNRIILDMADEICERRNTLETSSTCTLETSSTCTSTSSKSD